MIFIHATFKQYLLLVYSNNHHGSNKIVEITADTYRGLPECSWLEIMVSERERGGPHPLGVFQMEGETGNKQVNKISINYDKRPRGSETEY